MLRPLYPVNLQFLLRRCITTDRPELRQRTIACIENLMHEEGKKTAPLVGGKTFTGPLSLNVIVRSFNTPLLEAYLQFCVASGRSMGGEVRSSALPTRIQKWSVLSSPHVHKTAWTQFERRTFGRAFAIYGMHPEVIPKYIWYTEQHAPPDTWLECYIHEYIDCNW